MYCRNNENIKICFQEEKLELQPEFERKLAKRIKIAGKTGELNFMMEGLTYFPMGVFQEEVQWEQGDGQEEKETVFHLESRLGD